MDRLEELKSIGGESNGHALKIVQLRDDNGFTKEEQLDLRTTQEANLAEFGNWLTVEMKDGEE